MAAVTKMAQISTVSLLNTRWEINSPNHGIHEAREGNSERTALFQQRAASEALPLRILQTTLCLQLSSEQIGT